MTTGISHSKCLLLIVVVMMMKSDIVGVVVITEGIREEAVMTLNMIMLGLKTEVLLSVEDQDLDQMKIDQEVKVVTSEVVEKAAHKVMDLVVVPEKEDINLSHQGTQMVEGVIIESPLDQTIVAVEPVDMVAKIVTKSQCQA